MSTNSVTTAVEKANHQVSDVTMRNRLLDALTVSSGAVDAVSFLALGKVFTAFVTGNVAFLGMAIASTTGSAIYGVAPPRVTWVLAALAGFAAGIYLATKIVRPSRHEGEQPNGVVWPQRTTFALGVSLLAHLCFVLMWFATSARPGDNVVPVLLAVWALAMGMQSAAVRNLNVGGIFTTAATATFIFLFGAVANGVPLTGDERRRMRGVLVSLAIGATVGGLLLIHAPIYAPVLPFVITIGVVAMAAKAFRYDDEAHESRGHVPATV
jgi:Predicted membrane protein